MATNQEVQKALGDLYAIAEAGEKGFATAAANVHDRGLKILLKSYAQQRAKFKEQILAEIHRLDANYQPKSSIPGMIHRGRVAIYAAMTVQIEDREMVILKEAVVGERAAVKAYARALEKDLPPEIHQTVQQQFDEISRVSDQVNLIRGREGKRMVVRLFDDETVADRAIEALGQNGFARQEGEKAAINKATDLYGGRGVTAMETLLSGAVGGAVWGVPFGLLASFGMNQMGIPALLGFPSGPVAWVLVTLAVIGTGALVGGFLGFLIGLGIAEDDSYHYQKSADQGQYIVRALVDEGRAREARRIMDQIDHQPGEPAWGT